MGRATVSKYIGLTRSCQKLDRTIVTSNNRLRSIAIAFSKAVLANITLFAADGTRINADGTYIPNAVGLILEQTFRQHR